MRWSRGGRERLLRSKRKPVDVKYVLYFNCGSGFTVIHMSNILQ